MGAGAGLMGSSQEYMALLEESAVMKRQIGTYKQKLSLARVRETREFVPFRHVSTFLQPTTWQHARGLLPTHGGRRGLLLTTAAAADSQQDERSLGVAVRRLPPVPEDQKAVLAPCRRVQERGGVCASAVYGCTGVRVYGCTGMAAPQTAVAAGAVRLDILHLELAV